MFGWLGLVSSVSLDLKLSAQVMVQTMFQMCNTATAMFQSFCSFK